jgi:hypothetical protein
VGSRRVSGWVFDNRVLDIGILCFSGLWSANSLDFWTVFSYRMVDVFGNFPILVMVAFASILGPLETARHVHFLLPQSLMAVTLSSCFFLVF